MTVVQRNNLSIGSGFEKKLDIFVYFPTLWTQWNKCQNSLGACLSITTAVINAETSDKMRLQHKQNKFNSEAKKRVKFSSKSDIFVLAQRMGQFVLGTLLSILLCKRY